MTDWGGRRSRIGVTSLEEFRNVIDCFINSIQKICVRCRNVDEIIVSSVLDILSYLIQLEVHCFRFK